MPIEFEPPPTHAITRCGQPSLALEYLRPRLSPITRCRSLTSAGYGAGPTAEPIT